MALTSAAIMLAAYAISFVLILSVNLSLAGAVEDTGNPLEGMMLRMTTISGIAFGAFVAIIVMSTFSGFPTALEIAGVITLLVVLITGLEILMLIGWFSAGVRLGLVTKGFSFTRYDDVDVREQITPPI